MELPRLLTVRSAKRHGLTERQLSGPRFRRLLRGVYLNSPDEPTLTEQAAAALLVMPADAVIIGVTALWLHGVEVGSAQPVRVATATTSHTTHAGIRLSRLGRLPAARRRLAVPTDAWLAACAELDLVETTMAADWLIRLGSVTADALRSAAAGATGPGGRIARRAAALARSGAESPQETRLRLLLVLAGLPEPTCNPMIGTGTAPIGRFDLALEEFMTLIEYDGDHHRTDPIQWSRDIARQEAAVRAGYSVIRVTHGRMQQPREIAATVADQLRTRGYRGRPPSFNRTWRKLFEPG
ncbi:hypothetical protein [Microlunatus parietis]|uniref:DUF559 domain-containing protein n=1 Tax=Microlunatus parietis TaxID=682979 RepID=A0A7Y9I7V6_9ACTN|nr:hypothetical protein [Microlunatus parietis]NYE71374.1 hypothetical protein [Microlunatus parietis]